LFVAMHKNYSDIWNSWFYSTEPEEISLLQNKNLT